MVRSKSNKFVVAVEKFVREFYSADICMFRQFFWKVLVDGMLSVRIYKQNSAGKLTINYGAIAPSEVLLPTLLPIVLWIVMLLLVGDIAKSNLQ